MARVVQVAVPGDSSVHAVVDSDSHALSGKAVVRNTGTVNLLLGGKSDGSDAFYPINTGDAPLVVDLSDTIFQDSGGDSASLYVKVASGTTAGQLTVMVL